MKSAASSSAVPPNPPPAAALPRLTPPNEAAFSRDVESDRPDIKFFAFISGDNMFFFFFKTPFPPECPAGSLRIHPDPAGSRTSLSLRGGASPFPHPVFNYNFSRLLGNWMPLGSALKLVWVKPYRGRGMAVNRFLRRWLPLLPAGTGCRRGNKHTNITSPAGISHPAEGLSRLCPQVKLHRLIPSQNVGFWLGRGGGGAMPANLGYVLLYFSHPSSFGSLLGRTPASPCPYGA